MIGAEENFTNFVESTTNWFRVRATRNQFAYYGIRGVLILISAALPALIAKEYDTPATIAAVLVAVLAGLDAQFKPGEVWKHHRSVQLALLTMRRRFDRDLVDQSKDKAFADFYNDVEALLTAEAGQFWGLRITQWAKNNASN